MAFYLVTVAGTKVLDPLHVFFSSSQYRRHYKSPNLFCITALGGTGPETIITIAIETLDIMGREGFGFLLVTGYRDTIVFPSFSFLDSN